MPTKEFEQKVKDFRDTQDIMKRLLANINNNNDTSITSGRAASSTASSDPSVANRTALVKMIELISKKILTIKADDNVENAELKKSTKN